MPAARKIGDQLRVFIVGMRGDVERGAEFAEAAKVLEDFGGRICFRLGLDNQEKSRGRANCA